MSVALAVIATACSMARSWPQVVRIVVKKQDVGVSTLSWKLMMCSFITWTGIGLANGVFALTVTNLLNIVGASSVLFVVAHHRRESKLNVAAVMAGCALATAAVFALGGVFWLEAFGILLSISMFLPQAYTAARKPIDGVSPLSWFLAFITTSMWAAYGLSISEWSLVWPTTVLAPASAFIFLKAFLYGRRRVSIPRTQEVLMNEDRDSLAASS